MKLYIFFYFSWIYKKGRYYSYVHYWCFCWLYVKKVRAKHFLPIHLLNFVCSCVIIIMKEGKLLFPCMKCYHGKLAIKIFWELTGSASSQLEHLSSAKPRCYFPLAVWNEISRKCFPHTPPGDLGIGHVTCCGQHVLLCPPLSTCFATLPLIDFKFSVYCLLVFNVYKFFVFCFCKWSGWGGQPGMATSGVWKSFFCSKWMISFEGVSWIMNNEERH